MKRPNLLPILFTLLWQGTLLFAQEPLAVSIAYDNSGSMLDNGAIPCDAVRYSTQILINLLGSDDQLFLTPTDAPSDAKAFNLRRKGSAIKYLNRLDCDGGTPFQTVETSINAVRDDGRGSPWLVILSDGAFDRPNPQAIQEYQRYTEGGNSILFQIGGNANAAVNAAVVNNGGESYQSDGSLSSIKGRLAEIYARILGIPGEGLKNRLTFGGETVSFENELSLYELIIIHQGELLANAVTLEEATHKQAGTLEVETLETVKGQGGVQLQANMFKVSGVSGALISKGEVSLKFSQAIDPADLIVLPKVALQLKVFPDTINQEVYFPSKNTFHYTDAQARIFAQLLDPVSGLPVSSSVSSQSAVKLSNNRSSYQMQPDQSGTFTTQLPVTNEPITYTAEAVYPGYFEKISNVFIIQKAPCDPCVPDLNPSIKNIQQTLADFRDQPDRFEILPSLGNDPIPVPMEGNYELKQVDQTGIRAKIRAEDNKWIVELRPALLKCCQAAPQDGNLVFRMLPRRSDNNIQPATVSIPIHIEDQSFLQKWGGCILGAILILLVSWYLYRIFTKARFAKGQHLLEEKAGIGDKLLTTTRHLRNGWFNKYLWPSKRERYQWNGIIFYAKNKTRVTVKSSSIPSGSFYNGIPIEEVIEEPRKKEEFVLMDADTISLKDNFKTTYTFKKS